MPLCPIRLEIDPLAAGSPLPIDLITIKQHCRVDGADDDALLQRYLFAAVAWAEGATHRTIFQRAHHWVLKDFPSGMDQMIRLPRGKTQSVADIKYVNAAGLQTLRGPSSGSPAGVDYQEDLRGDDGAILMPPKGASWPSVERDVPAPVTVTFTAGWSAAAVPADIIYALLFAIEDAYDLRGTPDFAPAMIAAGGARLETREALISGYRLSRWY